MSRPLKTLAVLSAVLALLAVTGFFLVSAWYQDDVCVTEEWKCDAGRLGLSLFVYCGAPAVVLGSATLLMVVAGRHRR